MKYSIRVDNQSVLVKLEGMIYTEEADKLRAELLVYTTQGYNCFYIDMSEVQYIDSAGIAALISLQKAAVRLRGKVTLNGIQGVVKELFEMTQMGQIFELRV